MKLPCLIPVRGGSTRLPRKWELPWDGQSLLHHTILRVIETPSVERIIVSSDSEEILEHARLIGPGVELLLEPTIPNEPGSIVKTIARVRRMCKLTASYLMLVQCTSPFVNPADLEHLVEYAFEKTGPRAYEVFHTSHESQTDQSKLSDEFFTCGVNGRESFRVGCEYAPSGMGYIFGPKAHWPTGQRHAALQQAPKVDIDTMADYEAALKLRSDWKGYGMDKHAS